MAEPTWKPLYESDIDALTSARDLLWTEADYNRGRPLMFQKYRELTAAIDRAIARLKADRAKEQP